MGGGGGDVYLQKAIFLCKHSIHCDTRVFKTGQYAQRPHADIGSFFFFLQPSEMDSHQYRGSCFLRHNVDSKEDLIHLPIGCHQMRVGARQSHVSGSLNGECKFHNRTELPGFSWTAVGMVTRVQVGPPWPYESCINLGTKAFDFIDTGHKNLQVNTKTSCV